MAGKSAKKHAANNTRFLNQAAAISAGITVLSLARLYFGNDRFPWFKYLALQLPLAVCLYVLNKTGRPVFRNGELVNEGSMINLTDPVGLVEYMVDILYLSWCGGFTITLFNTFKLIYIVWFGVVPCFVVYKLYQLKQQFWPNGSFLSRRKRQPKNTIEEPTKSKRQLKKEQQKKSDKVKYRNR